MSQPNFIFILIDDLGWADLSCYGSEFYETPNLDRLATEGMRFTDAYAACPVCSPTRASILTGKYPATVGITNFIGGDAQGKLLCAPYLQELPLEEKTVASTLRDAGYRTYHVGKWHLGKDPYCPQNHGYDVTLAGGPQGMPTQGYFSPYSLPGIEDGPEGEFLTDRLTDEAIRLVQESGDQPFFLNLPYYSVHIPIQAPAEWVEKFRRKAEELGLDKQEALIEGEPFPCEHKRHLRIVRRIMQSDPTYAGMVGNLDWNIGRLLAALDACGKAEDTVVIFTSDNGGCSTAEGSPTCNAPLNEGKGWMYEGGTREPLIVRWPGVVEPGSTCHAPMTSPDFYPTLLEAAGLPLMPEQHCDGVSLMPLLRGGDSLDREAIFWHYPHYSNQGTTPGSSVRRGDWKLIEYFEDGRVELYNLREDISEERDLANDKPALAKELQAMLAEWRESVEAKIPEANPNWRG